MVSRQIKKKISNFALIISSKEDSDIDNGESLESFGRPTSGHGTHPSSWNYASSHFLPQSLGDRSLCIFC